MNGTRLPENWEPNPNLRAWAVGRRPDIDINEAIEQFRDYWCALPDRKQALKSSWDRTFRNFIRNPVLCRQAPKPNFRSVLRESLDAHVGPPKSTLSTEQRAANKSRLADLIGNLFGKSEKTA